MVAIEEQQSSCSHPWDNSCDSCIISAAYRAEATRRAADGSWDDIISALVAGDEPLKLETKEPRQEGDGFFPVPTVVRRVDGHDVWVYPDGTATIGKWDGRENGGTQDPVDVVRFILGDNAPEQVHDVLGFQRAPDRAQLQLLEQ